MMWNVSSPERHRKRGENDVFIHEIGISCGYFDADDVKILRYDRALLSETGSHVEMDQLNGNLTATDTPIDFRSRLPYNSDTSIHMVYVRRSSAPSPEFVVDEL